MSFSLIKNVCSALAASMLAAFFVPWLQVFFFGISGYDIVLGNFQIVISPFIRFFIVLIPVNALLILNFSVGNNGRYLFSYRGLFLIMPLVLLTILLTIFKLIVPAWVGVGAFVGIFAMLGFGVWITLICSSLLFLIGVLVPMIRIAEPYPETQGNKISVDDTSTNDFE